MVSRLAGVSGLFMCFLWLTKLHPTPRVDNKFFKALLVVAAFHTVGHVAACTSFGQMAVSFAHIVKSAEPVFSVALAGPILKETYPYYVWLSLVPIVAGCGLSAMKEVSFAWNGFNNAMLSNIGMVLRNIYSKKALGDYKVCFRIEHMISSTAMMSKSHKFCNVLCGELSNGEYLVQMYNIA